jgi:hypothetical protein
LADAERRTSLLKEELAQAQHDLVNLNQVSNHSLSPAAKYRLLVIVVEGCGSQHNPASTEANTDYVRNFDVITIQT